MEATVALGVFTIGMLGLGGAFSQIVHANAVSRQKQIAVLLAERKLSEFRMAQSGALTPMSGTFAPPFENYAWEAQVAPQSEDLQRADVWVEVRHRSGTQARLWSQMEIADGS